MQIDPRHSFDLTYCTNIHPGEDWSSVEATLRDAGPNLKARLSPDKPFGLGLRLSALAAREAIEGGRVAPFRKLLDENGLYVMQSSTATPTASFTAQLSKIRYSRPIGPVKAA